MLFSFIVPLCFVLPSLDIILLWLALGVTGPFICSKLMDHVNFYLFFLMKTNYLVSRWGTDPSSLGCYSYDAVGKPHGLYERLRSPVDNLFWAGEATSERFPGTVHGAFATGVMAGNECLKRFAERCRDLQMFQPVMAKEDELITPLQISRM